MKHTVYIENLRNTESLRQKQTEEYWVNKLLGTGSFTAPGNRRTAGPPERVRERVNAACTGAIRSVARNSLSEYTLYLSLFGFLLQKYFGWNGVIAGPDLPAEAGPDQPAGAGHRPDRLLFYGLDLSPEATLKEVIGRTQGEIRQVLSHRGFDYQEVKRVLGSKQTLLEEAGHAGLCFDQAGPPGDLFEALGLGMHLAAAGDGGLEITLAYDPAVTEPYLAGGLVRHYKQLLEGFRDRLDLPLGQISVLTPAEEVQLLTRFNRPPQPGAVDTVMDLFSAQAARTPEKTALVCDGRTWSYRALDEESSRLARCLREEYAVTPEQPVGLMVEHSEWVIIGMLGILKAGAAYVPIDPGCPPERVKYILEDTGLSTLLLLSGRLFDLPYFAGNLLALDVQLDAMPPADPGAEVPGDGKSLAYIMYTSGTTGRPKGVMIENASVVNYARWLKEAYGLGAGDSSVLLASYAFDLGYTSIWGTLLWGGTLHVLPFDYGQHPVRLLQYAVASRISFVKATPSLFYMLTHMPEYAALGAQLRLRLVLLGGEPIRPEDVDLYLRTHPETVFVNHYGPTETTIGTIAHAIRRDDVPGFRRLPVIGRPIANSEVFIMDESLHLQPVGVWGELCVGGAGLARGYRNQPDVTESKFVPHPFRAGERMYRTGDYAKWLPDGTIAFRGRRDNQVKLRGYRIELGEVENALLAHPSVREAAVLVGEAEPRNLVAYYTGGEATDAAALRQHLAARLPEYMIPAFFVRLAALPLTPNGKTDRNALGKRAPETAGAAGGEVLLPRTPVERTLLEVWQQVLHRQTISTGGNFFALGGNSLLAVQVVMHLKERGFALTVADLFAYPVISRLAAFLESQAAEAAEGEAAGPVAALPERPHYPVSHAQKRLWILRQQESEASAYNVGNASLFTSAVDREALGQAFRTLIERHETLRTTFAFVDGEVVQRVARPAECDFAVQYADLRKYAFRDKKAQAMAIAEGKAPFDLAAGPLLRATLLQLEDEKYVLLLTLHHIVSDAWSKRVMLQEIEVLYEAYRRGLPDPLPALPFQYKDYVAWQQSQLRPGAQADHRRYWLDQLQGQLPVLQLPADFPRPAVKTHNGATAWTFIEPGAVAGMQKMAGETGSTLFTVVLTAVKALLYRYSGQEDIIVGVPVAGREHAGLQNMIGLFVNTLAIRTVFNGEESFEKLLAAVRTNLVAAYRHQLYPFDLLAEDIGISSDRSRSPVFDVLVNLVNLDGPAGAEGEPGGLEAAHYSVARGGSKFDLSFTFQWVPKGLQLHLNYNTDLFSPETGEKMLRDFTGLLDCLVADPAGCPRRVPVAALPAEVAAH